jgi:demethylmenaquinone methyltransferase/2-methoxy-6-polyprenyl-1,4-benzoquinol methylase
MTDQADFGFQRVPAGEKTRRVYQVFESVASNYDLMNDLMSFGIHRLWKRYAACLTPIREDACILDVAGGTGDMARLYGAQLGPSGRVVVCDINREMLFTGRDRLTDAGLCRNISYVQGDAENLPFPPHAFDLISIAFGLRNVTDKQRALASMYDKLKYGRPLVILEFSRMAVPALQSLYDRYSWRVIPLLGRYIASDEQSYRYLVESIRMHPDQEALKSMMEAAGFSRVEYFNLSGGIAAVHRGYKT